jgi:hypothetical protein
VDQELTLMTAIAEEGFGWGKTIGGLRKLRHRGRDLVDWIFTFTTAAYNLVRIRTPIRAGYAPPNAPPGRARLASRSNARAGAVHLPDTAFDK